MLLVSLRHKAGLLALHVPALPATAPGHPYPQQVDAPQHRHPLDAHCMPVLLAAPALAQMRLDGHVEACQPEACHDTVAHRECRLSLLVWMLTSLRLHSLFTYPHPLWFRSIPQKSVESQKYDPDFSYVSLGGKFS